jgi:hypothetical protein
MVVINIVLKDCKKRIYFPMLFLRPETEDLIMDNINTINRITGSLLQISNIEPDNDYSQWERQGWKLDQGLYEVAIIEYNQSHTPLLIRWK